MSLELAALEYRAGKLCAGRFVPRSVFAATERGLQDLLDNKDVQGKELEVLQGVKRAFENALGQATCRY